MGSHLVSSLPHKDFDEWVNVKTYGATGDGSTDDTTAIQNAITAAGTGMVFFPKGTYKVTTTLDISGNFYGISLCGANRGGTTILWAGNSTTPIIDATGSMWVSLRDMLISSPAATPANVGLLLGRNGTASSDNHYFENLRIQGDFIIAALYEVTSERNIYNNIYLENSYNGDNSYAYIRSVSVVFGVTSPYQTLTASDGNTSGMWLGGFIQADDRPAALINGVLNFSFHGTGFYSNDADGAAIVLGGLGNGTFACGGLTFDNIRTEGTALNSINLSTADIFRKITINDSQLTGDAQTGCGVYGVDDAELREFTLKQTIHNAVDAVNVDTLKWCDIACPGNRVTARTSAIQNKFLISGAGEVVYSGTHTGNIIYSTGDDQTLCTP